MIFRLKSKTHVSLEPIALADIVLNLFVFFFITFGLFATFDPAQKGTFPIDLPRAKQSSLQKASKPLVITIDSAGSLYLGARTIPRSEFVKVLNRELSFRKDKTVSLRADRSISLDQFVSVLDLVRSTKAEAISIETEIHSPPSGSK